MGIRTKASLFSRYCLGHNYKNEFERTCLKTDVQVVRILLCSFKNVPFSQENPDYKTFSQFLIRNMNFVKLVSLIKDTSNKRDFSVCVVAF